MGLQGSPLLLMLLATALVLLAASVSADQYERFLLQHFNAKPKGRNDDYCNKRMRWMMNEDKRRDGITPDHCKEKNTFIHGNSDKIRDVCTAKGGKDYRTESSQLMRQSLNPFQVTNCKNHGGTPLNNCKYRASPSFRTIVIRCNGTGFPVHLNETLI